MGSRLPLSFFTRTDTLAIGRELLGTILVTEIEGIRTSGKIVETEAYLGREDRACHAWNDRRTARTEIMFAQGGYTYVYLCYGIHHLFNIVTNLEGEPHAILIRAVEPIEGIPTMLERRGKSSLQSNLTAGPGSMSKALGIETKHTGNLVEGPPIWVEGPAGLIADDSIIASARVGVDYAGEDALLPYRFRIRNNIWTSPAK